MFLAFFEMQVIYILKFLGKKLGNFITDLTNKTAID